MPVTQSVIDLLLTPQVGELIPVLDTDGPFTGGNHALTTFHDGVVLWSVGQSAGCMLQFNGSIPPYLGLTPGFDDGGIVQCDVFEKRLVQLVVLHQFPSGGWVVTQLEEVHYLPFFTRWDEAIPGKIGLYVLPNISVDIYFLQTPL